MASHTSGRRLVQGGIVLLALALLPVWPAAANPDATDEELEQAILKVIEKLTFPATCGDVVIVSYSFVFGAS